MFILNKVWQKSSIKKFFILDFHRVKVFLLFWCYVIPVLFFVNLFHFFSLFFTNWKKHVKFHTTMKHHLSWLFKSHDISQKKNNNNKEIIVLFKAQKTLIFIFVLFILFFLMFSSNWLLLLSKMSISSLWKILPSSIYSRKSDCDLRTSQISPIVYFPLILISLHKKKKTYFFLLLLLLLLFHAFSQCHFGQWSIIMHTFYQMIRKNLENLTFTFYDHNFSLIFKFLYFKIMFFFLYLSSMHRNFLFFFLYETFSLDYYFS